MSQLGALVGLRWRMVRRRRVRIGFVVLLGLFLLALVEAVVVGQSLPPGKRLFDLLLLAPTIYLVFAALAVVAPLVAGGGNELFPEGQLVAYPIRPRTVFTASLLMAPLNLAWGVQVLICVGVTAAVSERGPLVLLAVFTVLAYIGLITMAGQALAWAVVGVRQRRAGRIATRAAGFAVAIIALVVIAGGWRTALLDRSPTTRIVIGAINGSQGRLGPWALVTGILLVLTAISAWLGGRACDWSLRRTSPAGRPELAPLARRPARRTALAELVAIDRSSVWRSTSLRRGAIVLAILPGTVAMLASPTWATLSLLPGLVAAGAGLLFGVNAFCLDGGGAVWVATLPHDARTTLVSKLVVVTQTCVLAVVLAIGLAASQIRMAPTTAEALALLGSILGSTLLVVATCARLSVTRPHKADLRGPRDTPAPPATMAVYSLRLAFGTTWAGLIFAGTGASGSIRAVLVGWLLVACLGIRSLVSTLGHWSSPAERSHVVTTVAYG